MSGSAPFAVAAAIRRSRSISLDEVSRQTRIGTPYLRAIERMDFSSLPGGVYNTSYIRQYARAVGVDEGEMVAAYLERMPQAGSPARLSRVQRLAAVTVQIRQKVLAALERLLPQ
jgi:cytoskeletal protein RodZ